MIRTLGLSTLLAFALASPASTSYAGLVPVNFSGGGNTPLTITLPRALTYTVTNDTPSPAAAFVFLDVGNATGNTVRASSGTLGYTVNGGGSIPIDSVGNFVLGSVDTNDLTIFKSGSGGVNLNDVVLLSSGSVTTNSNVSAAAPPSGAYSAILIDINGTQLGVGNALGDFNDDAAVNGTDIDLLCDRINAGTGPVSPFDVNGDGSVNQADVNFEVTNILNTKFGDTDTDGDVDLSDLGNLATGFGQPGEKRWSRGNFDCDGDVDLNDLGTLATNFQSGRAAALAQFETLVPEPAAGILMLVLFPRMIRPRVLRSA